MWRLALLVALFTLLPHAKSLAQVALSAALDSDYRVRGLSYSDERPTLSLSLAYDQSSGIYGGVSAIGVDTRHAGLEGLGYIVYAGYAHRLGPDRAWDVGLSNSSISVYLDRRYTANYTELYAGMSVKSVTVHLYYSPRYIGEAAPTLYLDAAASYHPARRWRVYGHAGVLTPLTAGGSHATGRTRADFSLGVAHEFRPFEIHVQWSTTAPRAVYPEYHRQDANAVSAGVVAYF